MNYSVTQLGNVIKLISAILVVMGANPLSEEEANAIIITIGLIGEAIGFLTSWFGRYRKGDLTIGGFRKEVDY